MAADVQRIIALKDNYKRTWNEIANELGGTYNGVRNQYRRAKRKATIIQDDVQMRREDEFYYPSARDINDADMWESYLKSRRQYSRMLKIQFWPDLHIKDTNWQAVELALQIAAEIEPDVHFFLGDEWDFDTLSTHWSRASNRKQQDAFGEVAVYWHNLINRLKQINSKAVFAMIGGNHTRGRVERFIDDNAPMLADTIIEAFINLARSNGRVWWLGWSDEAWVANLHIEHGVRYGENSAKNSSKDLGWGTPRVGGHVHAPSEHWNFQYVMADNLVTPTRYIVQSVTLPCLANLHPHYANDRKKSRWMNGIGLAHVNLNGRDVHIQKVIFHQRTNGDLTGVVGADEFTQQAGEQASRKAG